MDTGLLRFPPGDMATRRLIDIEAVATLAQFRWHLVCPVFDAAVAAPGPKSLPRTAAMQDSSSLKEKPLSDFEPMHACPNTIIGR